MDESRFDDLARLLGASGTRRAGLRVALAGALGLGAAAAGLDAGAADTDAGRKQRTHDGPRAERKRSRKRRCKPACSAVQECRKGACVCRDGGVPCGPACCAADERCRDGACVEPEPACVPFGEACKATGRPCCDGLACGSGQGGETDVACYKPAGMACASTAECAYGTTCTGGECVADPQPAPEPELVCDVTVAGGPAALQAALDAPPAGGAILIEPGAYAGDFTVDGKELKLKRCGDRGEVVLRNLTPMPTCDSGDEARCDALGRTLAITGQDARVTLDTIVVECGTCAGGTGGGILLADGRLELIGASEVRGGVRTLPTGGSRGGGILATGQEARVTVGGSARVANNAANVAGAIALASGAGLVVEGSARIENNRAAFPSAMSPQSPVFDKWRAGGIEATPGSDLQFRGSSVVAGNVAHQPEDGRMGSLGGGAYVNDGTVTIEEQATFERNDAYVGGALYVLDTTLVVRGSARLADNVARGIAGGYTGGGGGISATIGSVTIEGDARIEDNSGCGIQANSTAVTVDGRARIAGNTFSYGERAHQDYGGGITAQSTTTVTLKGSASITGNSTTGNGGGIRLLPGSSLTMGERAEITSNTAQSGGGIHVAKATVVIEGDAKIDGNQAGNGGGITVRFREHNGENGAYQTVLRLRGNAVVSNNVSTNASTRGNTARGGGGGLRINGGTVHLEGSAAVVGNKALTDDPLWNAHGGGIRLIVGTLDLTNAQADAIRGNFADSATSHQTSAYNGNGVGGLAAGTKARPNDWTINAPGGGLASIIKSDNLPYRCGGVALNADCSEEP